MKLQVPFVQLPLQFDAARLASEVRALGDQPWRPHPQGYPGNFALPLISAHGNPDSDSIAGPMRPTPWLDRCPYLMQVLARLGAVWGRTRLMKLSGQAEVTPHADINYYWRDRVRVHVPVLTRPSVRFICGDAEVNMAAGECWIFDTWREHRVINAADDERIHLVADTVGSEAFWDLVGQGRAPGRDQRPGWQAQPHAPVADSRPGLRFETMNVPQVMTPWELRDHIGFLLGDLRPHPQAPVVQQLAARFVTTWQALWSQYGSEREGWAAYRAAIDALIASLQPLAAPLQLVNGTQFMPTLRSMVLKVALADRQDQPGADEPRAPQAKPAARAVAGSADAVFDRPIFIVSPPRSGSTLLFETLARARGLCTIGRESHALMEGIAELHPAQRGYDSNRLDATAVAPGLADALRERFRAELRDRDGDPPAAGRVRMLEKTPKNALRVPFLARIFPEARFVYLHRDPRPVLSSMIEAWQSGRFCTYPQLPDWQGPAWSMLLTPGWRALAGKSLPEIVAAQWESTTRLLLDDLDALPAERRCVARYESLLDDPATEILRLCQALDLDWDLPPPTALPLARYAVSPPDPEKWRRHADVIETVWPGLVTTHERARRFAAG
ncbi:MAG: sulfotransferase [Xanthomonadaceae bacterium]|nr:sulfotransferase [Xanthomonadaceae bacterium]